MPCEIRHQRDPAAPTPNWSISDSMAHPKQGFPWHVRCQPSRYGSEWLGFQLGMRQEHATPWNSKHYEATRALGRHCKGSFKCWVSIEKGCRTRKAGLDGSIAFLGGTIKSPGLHLHWSLHRADSIHPMYYVDVESLFQLWILISIPLFGGLSLSLFLLSDEALFFWFLTRSSISQQIVRHLSSQIHQSCGGSGPSPT